MLLANTERLKHIQSAYIKKRVNKISGKAVCDAFATKVPGKANKLVKYRAADLRWDLKHEYLVIEGENGVDTRASLALLHTLHAQSEQRNAPLHTHIPALTAALTVTLPPSQAQAAAVKQLSTVAGQVAAQTSCSTLDVVIPPLGRVPKSEKDLQSFPEPYRTMWELAAAEEQLAQLQSTSFDYIPASAARNAMSRNPTPLVRVYKEKMLPNLEDGTPRLERMKVRDAYNGARAQEGYDYTPVAAPTMTCFSHKLLHALARLHGWASTSFDVPSAYLKT